jgi:hypothetical protein
MPAVTLSSFSWILGVVLALGYWWIKSSPQSSFDHAGKRTPAARVDGQKKVEQDAAALWKKWESELQKKQETSAPSDSLEKQPPAEVERPVVPKENPPAVSLKDKEPQERLGKDPARNPLEPPRIAAAVRPKPVAPVLRNEKLYAPPQPATPPPTVEKKVLTQPQTPAPQVARQEMPATKPIQEQTMPAAPAMQPAPAPEMVKVPAPPATAVTTAPTSGRLIWTGHLQKNQTLTIEGANASTGSFTGELPGKPIQLKIWPGDLADDGIVMYTANAQGASAAYEPPGPQNGWNKTLYTLNPRRAAEILLVEPPGPQNGWKRLVLRSKSQKASVILVEWTLSR